MIAAQSASSMTNTKLSSRVSDQAAEAMAAQTEEDNIGPFSVHPAEYCSLQRIGHGI